MSPLQAGVEEVCYWGGGEGQGIIRIDGEWLHERMNK